MIGGILSRIINSKFIKGFAVTAATLLGIWGTFYYERKPQLQIEVLSDSPVFDVRESLTKLDVTYDGLRLRENKLQLRIYIFRIVNTGSADILKSYFDEGAPLGIRFSTGKVLETPTVTADDYLKTNIRASVLDGKSITFAPVILNAGDGFEIKVLMLVEEGVKPSVSEMGKIAGIKTIKLIFPGAETQRKSLIGEATEGALRVQIVRLPIYFVAMVLSLIIFMLVIVLPITLAADRLSSAKRRKTTAAFRKRVARALNAKEEILLRLFEEASFDVSLFKAAVGGGPVINVRSASPVAASRISNQELVVDREMERVYDVALKRLETAGLVLVDGPQMFVSPDIVEFAIDFFTYCDEHFSTSMKKQTVEAAELGPQKKPTQGGT